MSINEIQPDLFGSIDRQPRPIRSENIDVTARKHGGAPTSEAANRLVNKDADNARVLEIIKADGKSWLKEAARQMGKFPNQISGRFTWLAANGYIAWTGEVEEKCRVFRWTGKR